MDYILLALNWVLFYTLCSLLAASKIKRILEVKWGKANKWYLLVHALLTILILSGITTQALLIHKTVLLSKSDLTDYLGYMLAGFGTIIVTKSSKKYSLKRLLGFESSSEEEKLVTSGLYSKIRHPLYAGLVLIFSGYFLFSGTITAAVHLGCFILYLPIGISLKEKELLLKYGDAYRGYKTTVPALIPKLG